MSRAAALFRLQQIDQEIDAKHSRLREVESALGQVEAVEAAQAALASVRVSLAEARQMTRALEDEIARLAAHIAEVESALYGGKIQNPKELNDMQAEVASLQRRKTALEDKLIDLMVLVEKHEAEEKTAQARLTEAEAVSRQQQGALIAEKAALEAALKRLAIERQACEAPIPAADREMYQSLRQRKNGLAVARLEDGACAACGVAPSSSRAQAARQGGELVRCGNCERILYGG